MKKNILIVHNYYQIPGGEDTVVANETDLLKQNGHNVYHYFRNNSELNDMSKLRKVFLPFSTIFNIRTYFDICRIIKNNDIEIVHVHNTLNLISPAVYYAAVKCNVPVVQTIHNFRLLCPGATFYRDGNVCEDCVQKGLKCSIKHRCYRDSLAQTMCCVILLGIHRFTGIYRKINYICLTEFNKDKLLSINNTVKKPIFYENKVFVKPNFMSIKKGSIEDQEALQSDEKSYAQRKKQFLFAGRLDETKGVDILLKAWKMLGDSENVLQTNDYSFNIDDYSLIICGVGPMEDWCKKYIADNRLANVKMLGKVSHEKVLGLMKKSLATILPTRWYEGFPMSIAESFSVATPVIGPAMGNVGNLIENGRLGLTYDYTDESDLSSVIFEYVKYYKDYVDGISEVNMYQEAYEEYVNKYSADINYKILMDIYDKV